MKNSVSMIALILVVGAAAAPSFAQNRARPGSVTGATVLSASRMPMNSGAFGSGGLGNVGSVDANTNVNLPPVAVTPVLPPVVPPVEPDDNECGEIIPFLGVDACVARRACEAITADGFYGKFNPVTYGCDIPVVAHNWGGVIFADGKPVMTYMPMGETMRCNAKMFEGIEHMRRTSQWVVPTMIAGGAGLGAAGGAIADEVARNKAQKQADQYIAGVSMSQTATGAGASYVTLPALQPGGELRVYNLPADAERLRADLAMDVANGKPYDLLAEYYNNLVGCEKLNFAELVATHVRTDDDSAWDDPKLGRIKITKSTDTRGTTACQGMDRDFANSAKTEYCHFDLIHAQGMVNGRQSIAGDLEDYVTTADCNYDPELVVAGTESDREKKNYLKGSNGVNKKFYGDANCYYRDGNTRIMASDTNNTRGTAAIATETEYRSDATAPYDITRYHNIEVFRDNATLAGIAPVAGQAKYNVAVQRAQDLQRVLDNYAFISSAKSQGYSMNYFVIYGLTESDTFDKITGANIDALRCDRTGAFADQIAYYNGAIDALEQLGGSTNVAPDVAGLRSQFAATMQIDTTMNITVAGGADKKSFFETGVGAGLAIGTGVGTLAGIGYYFAEGASVFCNAGGLSQVRLDRTYSIPTLREYLIKHGYIGVK